MELNPASKAKVNKVIFTKVLDTSKGNGYMNYFPIRVSKVLVYIMNFIRENRVNLPYH